MRVPKIIQANPEIFNTDQNKSYTEIEAIRLIASMSGSGNEIQKKDFEIRQTHTAIRNLINLGFRDIAVDLATNLIPEAELSQQYKVAQDLCDILITNFYQENNSEAVLFYKNLYDKFTDILSYEHESMLLYGKAIQNYKSLPPKENQELKQLLDAIKSKLPMDSLWYHYYYFQYKSLMCSGYELEQVYIQAIQYFEALHYNHDSFIHHFSTELIKYYQGNNEVEKAKKLILKLEQTSGIHSQY